jgi:hypothetical protein
MGTVCPLITIEHHPCIVFASKKAVISNNFFFMVNAFGQNYDFLLELQNKKG